MQSGEGNIREAVRRHGEAREIAGRISHNFLG
jgi:hypothetical protein